MKSLGGDTHNKFVVNKKQISNSFRGVIILLIVFLILNPLVIGDIIRQPKLEVVVDSVHKYVSPKEDAIFNWTVYNNETFLTFEVTVQSEPETEFSNSHFFIGPGERKKVVQRIHISSNLENNTNLSYIIHWNGIWEKGATSGTISIWSGEITVTIINKSVSIQTLQYELPKPDTQSKYMPIFIFVSVPLVYLVLIIIKKK
ncbi:MAG: hypothetical protein JSW00_02685 [Thermoplasmata archaeon]|nr:MAG: hypothetical protein JSW00_02685 [Thermoplasmata archaeon]